MFSATVYAPAAYAAMAGSAGTNSAQPVRVNRMISGIRDFFIFGSLDGEDVCGAAIGSFVIVIECSNQGCSSI